MAPPKPFLVEYAKSGRAACKICKDPITKDALRIAKVVQSRQFDGYMTMWHHYGCLLKKPGVFKTLHDVEGFGDLRWEDQKKLEKYITDSGGSVEEEEEEEEEEIDEEDKDFSMEYAKSSRSTCKECEEKIQKDEVRVSKLIESDNPAYPGMVPAWRHIKCLLESGMWSKDVKKIPGFRSLSKADRESVEKLAKGEIDEMPPKAEDEEKGKKGKGKKRKSKGGEEDEAEAEEEPKKKSRKRKKKGEDDEDEREEEPKETKKRGRKGKKEDDVTETKKGKAEADAAKKGKGKAKESEEETKPSKAAAKVKADPQLEKALEKQSRALWEVKDALRKHVSTSELREMLEVNDQAASGSEHELRDRCADGMLFGPLGKCPLCGSHMEYKEGHYCCRGFLSEWTKCTHTSGEALRLKAQWKLPEDNDNEYLDEWFQKQKKTKQRPDRILPATRGPPPTKKTKTEGGASAPAEPTEQKAFASLPLTGMRIAVAGHLKHNQQELKELIQKAGGEIASRMSRDVTCLVTTPDEAEKEKGNGKVVQARELRIPIVFETFLTDSVEKQQRLDLKEYMIENKGVSTVKVKGRSAVHEASGLQETGHILEAGKSIYNTTLNMSDMASGINSYYILQLIEEDNKKAVHVFRKWGRVGNERIGSQKIERLPKAEAIVQFKRLFREKTGNDWEAWEAKEELHKAPGKFYPLDIDYGVDEGGSGAGPSAPPGSRSKLDPRVVSLMKMLFDLETYRATMLEFEINLAEMPLGKLTKKQVTKGFEVLSSIQNLLHDSSAEPGRQAALLLDASNRFYTLVPAMHPNPINDERRLKDKIRMLEALRDIEIASRLIGDLSGQGDEEDPLDAHYRQLQCAVEPMPKDHPNWGLVEEYLHKTHAPTHKEWDLELEDVFCLDRSGEGAAYAPFKSSLPNKQLLWHGSRTSNYVGILSQGLRIAPPEAPVTGYMFGKGIYFADLVSKSAQYCYTSRGSPVGLMLLSEVALGEMHELRKAQYMEKAPRGKHSTKGLGKMVPDGSEFRKLDDDVTVPAGKPVPSNVRATELMYNEYIVYDTSQVRMRFLLKVRFKHK